MQKMISLLLPLLGLLTATTAYAFGPPLLAYHYPDFHGERLAIHNDWSASSSRDYWNDAINAVIVPAGYEAYLFEHSDFGGDFIVVRGEWSSAQDRYWHNRISSVRLVYVDDRRHHGNGHGHGHYKGRGRGHAKGHGRRPPARHTCGPPCADGCGYLPAPTITVYEHGQYGGASLFITGEWSAQDSRDPWNDCISSIYVPRGYAVILYQDTWFRGPSTVLEHSWTAYSSRDYWNDRISSIRVVRL